MKQFTKTDMEIWLTHKQIQDDLKNGIEDVGEAIKASPELVEKVESKLSTLPKDRQESIKRWYKVDKRGYWGVWGASNCLYKLGAI